MTELEKNFLSNNFKKVDSLTDKINNLHLLIVTYKTGTNTRLKTINEKQEDLIKHQKTQNSGIEKALNILNGPAIKPLHKKPYMFIAGGIIFVVIFFLSLLGFLTSSEIITFLKLAK